MNKNRKYPISKELLKGIVPTLRRLEGLSAILNTLGENIGRDKQELWETIYAEYPELRGKPLKINEFSMEINIVPMPED